MGSSLLTSSATSAEYFRNWCRDALQQVVPHGPLACVHGRVHCVGISIDSVLATDIAPSYFAAIRNAAGQIDSPLAQRWFVEREPVMFDPDCPWPGMAHGWIEAFKLHALGCTVAHGWVDPSTCLATYFSLHRVDMPLLEAAQRLREVIQTLHDKFVAVVAWEQAQRRLPLDGWERLSGREQQVLRLVVEGKTQAQTGDALGISGNTVKKHLAHALAKAGVRSRSELHSVMALRRSQAQQQPIFL